ncbi:MAG: protein kinase [Pyrinomonadaceae bacterium]|nr:protein kinase [Pyrinomonadaceae bacterium]
MLAPGLILQSRYRIVRQLGQGGMGTVWEAEDLRLDITVALKETLFKDERLRKQFEREARLMARLRHPAMTKVYDHFSEGEGQYIVMEYVSGCDLWEMIKERGAPFSPAEVLDWADQLLDALAYLHTQVPQIIHRDIKPQNLKFIARGQIILLDFGLAKGLTEHVSQVSTSGSILGYTPHYAPLEQIQGTGTDPRTDLYSLAATIYHLTTGIVPPDALTRITAVANEEPDPLRPANELWPEVSPELADLLMRAMSQNREKRPPSALAMRKMLREIAPGRGSVTDREATTLTQPPAVDTAPDTEGEHDPRATSDMPTVHDDKVGKRAGQAGRALPQPAPAPNHMRWLLPGLGLLLLIGLAFAAFSNRDRLMGMFGSGKLNRPLRVGIASWPGYAGGIVANNGFKPNKECLFWKKYNVEVEFVLLDKVEDRNEALTKGGDAGGVDIMWTTVDALTSELPVLIKDGVGARAIMQADWSRGGDAIVADESIKTIEELKGKKISLVPGSPSQWLLEYTLRNSALSQAEQDEIVKNLIAAKSSPDARADFVSNKVDAAVMWEPDITETLATRTGSHVLFSTKTASNLIADIMVAREDFIKSNPGVIKAFIKGWFDGTEEARRKPEYVVWLLTENEPIYKYLGPQATREGLQNVKWADLTDNTLMFGLDGNEPLFDKIFKQASDAWVARGYIQQPVPPDKARDSSYLKEIYSADARK